MQYYEYLNIDFTNYQNVIHVAQSGDCRFNVGVWGIDQGHELDASLQVSMDGNVWVPYESLTIHPELPYFIYNIGGVKMIRLYTLDNTVLNFAVREYYGPIDLMIVGS